MEQKVIVTVVDGLGVVEVQNDLAHFSLSLKSKSEKSENARSQVEEKTAQVLQALESLKAKGMRVEGDISTSVSNYRLEHREGGERIPVGFQAISTISWTTAVDGMLDEIYQTCLKFDANAPRPLFSLKDRVALSDQAIIKATENAKDKLKVECRLLDVSPDKLKIHNWNFGYEGYLPSQNITTSNYQNYSAGSMGLQGAVGATGPQGPMGSMGPRGIEPVVMKIGTTYQELLDYTKLNPGTVSVRIAVRVNYVWV